jgi:uncharacterized phage protein (TIGR01671 family)
MTNRIIKFRAWDSRNRIMETADVLDDEWESLAFKFQDAQYVMMQFTGLLDRNGKEIYEGDIVKLTWHPLDHKDPNALIGERIGYIEYTPFLGIHIIPGRFTEPVFIQVNKPSPLKSYREQKEGFQQLSEYNVKDHRIEIIGNIYENPELLK